MTSLLSADSYHLDIGDVAWDNEYNLVRIVGPEPEHYNDHPLDPWYKCQILRTWHEFHPDRAYAKECMDRFPRQRGEFNSMNGKRLSKRHPADILKYGRGALADEVWKKEKK